MTLATPFAIRDVLAPLIRDAEFMHTISVLGFDDADPAKVEENLAHAQQLLAGTWVDLRDADAGAAIEALLANAGETHLILVVDAGNISRPLAILFHQVIDRNRRIDLGDGRVLERPDDQSIFVLAQGVPDHDSAPPELQRIVIWQLANA